MRLVQKPAQVEPLKVPHLRSKKHSNQKEDYLPHAIFRILNKVISSYSRQAFLITSKGKKHFYLLMSMDTLTVTQGAKVYSPHQHNEYDNYHICG
jgi:hypothetical protein